MVDEGKIIVHTRKWIMDVVIGCNFCPFAAREISKNTVAFEVKGSSPVKDVLQRFGEILIKLERDPSIETFFLILPDSFASFSDYLDLVSGAELFIKKNKYEGVFQVASFHPDYLFADAAVTDPANFTNRSPYPMLHILREESVSKAVDSHPDPEGIPERNMAYARKKGLQYMQTLKNSSIE